MSRTDAPIQRRPPAREARQNADRLIEHDRRRCQALLDSSDCQPVDSVGIVGAGLMGTAVAAASLSAGLSVAVYDAQTAARDRAAENVFAQLVASGRATSQEADECVDRRLRVAASPDGVARCDLVLESVTETVAAKRAVYAELEPLLADHAILATNTSTIPLSQLATGLRRPERYCGVHFFHPVAQRPLVEIVRGPETSAPTIASAVGFARAIEKMALVIDDGPGFVVNRLLLPYLTEAVELVTDGVAIERVEAVATAFGMAKGPLALLDEIGLDTVIAGGRVLWAAFPRRVAISPLLIAMYKAGRFGVKSGAGFFRYDAASTTGMPRATARQAAAQRAAVGSPNRAAARMPGPERDSGPAPPRDLPPIDPVALQKTAEWGRTPQTLGDDDILDRLLLPMVLEATRLLEEGRVADPRDIDLGVLFGLGFPIARGGLLYWADTLGVGEVAARLGRLAGLGPRMEPTELLRRMSQTGQRFYDLCPKDAASVSGDSPLAPGDCPLFAAPQAHRARQS